MKKLFIAAAAVAGIALYSCNNGAYDAEPNVNNTGLNPTNPNSGVTVPLGTIKATINNVEYALYPSDYKDSAGGFYVQGQLKDDITFKRTFMFTFLGKDLDLFNYAIVDTLNDTAKVFYSYKGEDSSKKFTFVVTGSENGNMRGKFSGILRTPEGQVPSDSVVITNGEFYVPKNDRMKIVKPLQW